MSVEQRLETYLVARDWVSMREIKSDLALDWDDAERVWKVLLPGLVTLGFAERLEASDERRGARFRVTEVLRAFVREAGERSPEPARS